MGGWNRSKIVKKIMHACLLTCQVTVAPQIQLSIERSLASKPACYSFKNISTKDWIINAGSSEWRQENIFFNDFVADEILVLLIPLSNIQGSYSSSCLTAKPHNIKDLFLAVCSEYACARVRARAKARACVRMSVCVCCRYLSPVTYHLSPVTRWTMRGGLVCRWSLIGHPRRIFCELIRSYGMDR